ncbi:MAG: thioredoxin domain-containing protein, partial [Acidiferrobacterales bacterium]
MTGSTYTNHLAGETSPYLLQHVHNPVDWYPWNDEALALARQQDKPILVSIGYSACHWCHVMEHESFEDDATAAIMNEYFICIKVDREERPDLDKIYQTAYQMLMQRSGGWPLNMFITANDHIPFFGGTYFPNVPRYGMPAFGDLLTQLATFYRDNRDEIDEQNARMAQHFNQLAQNQNSAVISHKMLTAARLQIETQFNPDVGGFGGAPKFPHPTNLERCLRHWHRSKLEGGDDTVALKMVTTTLGAMANGGIYDQLRGGFYRYSVDEKWTIPHFEKMLYDNAQLLPLYVDASIATGDGGYARVANETARWVINEMQSPQGAYYSTLDADSEGEEGLYYTWSNAELSSLLNPQELDVLKCIYGLDGKPNFEGRWHLNIATSPQAAAKKLGHSQKELDEWHTSARDKLLAEQDQRIRPGRDEKILTAWNGLMISAYARAGLILDDESYIERGERAADFLLKK